MGIQNDTAIDQSKWRSGCQVTQSWDQGEASEGLRALRAHDF